MAEVTPDNNILKSSIFHRLLQRAFPGWFPYDSIRFFHPFYTGQTNARYAKEQGYASLFDVSGPFEGRYKIQTPEPKKPNKPLYLKKYTEIQAVLSKPANEIIHPAFVHAKNLPKKVAEALVCIQSKGTTTSKKLSDEDVNHIKMYFAKRTRAIVEREVIVMDKKKRIFQIDITRE